MDIEWPADQPRDLRLVYLVNMALMTGRVRVAMGGQANGDRSPGATKRAKRDEIAELVGKIAGETREGWEKQMHGVDQHCLRMTHRTWALVAGVPEILIDRQLGHTSPTGEAALKAAWSAVGRQYYTDMGFLTGDAKRSAQAVRQILDRATAEFQEIANRGETALKAPEKMGRLGIASA